MTTELKMNDIMDVIKGMWDDPVGTGVQPPYEDARFFFPVACWKAKGLFPFANLWGPVFLSVDDPDFVAWLAGQNKRYAGNYRFREHRYFTRERALRRPWGRTVIDKAIWDTVTWGSAGDLTGAIPRLEAASVGCDNLDDDGNVLGYGGEVSAFFYDDYLSTPSGGTRTITAKPTWDELVTAVRKHNLRLNDAVERTITGTTAHRTSLTDAAALAVAGESLYVGEGLDHMTGLLQMVEQAVQAGNNLPRITMRDALHNRRDIWLQSEVRAILAAVAHRENIVESAHNVVLESYQQQAWIRDDETADLDDREAAQARAKEIADNYATLLQAEIDAYDPDALPTDLPTLKKVYKDRLESAGMDRAKEIKGASTQQGVDLPASCRDQGDALDAIGEEVSQGAIEIDRAADDIWIKQTGTWNKVTHPSLLPTGPEEHEGDDPPDDMLGADGEYYRQLTGIPEAQLAFDTAVKKVELVSPLHIPVWQLEPTGQATTHHGDGETVTLKAVTYFRLVAEHPTAFTGKGNVVQALDPTVTYDDGSSAADDIGGMGFIRSGKSHAALVVVGSHTQAVNFTFRARSICGLSNIQIRIEPADP